MRSMSCVSDSAGDTRDRCRGTTDRVSSMVALSSTMPYWPRLIGLLAAAPHRITGGHVSLTGAEADMLRGCDFADAVAGPWRLPALPAHVLVPDFLRRVLAKASSGSADLGRQ